jgi:flagellar biosynthetic protein FliR
MSHACRYLVLPLLLAATFMLVFARIGAMVMLRARFGGINIRRAASSAALHRRRAGHPAALRCLPDRHELAEPAAGADAARDRGRPRARRRRARVLSARHAGGGFGDAQQLGLGFVTAIDPTHAKARAC